MSKLTISVVALVAVLAVTFGALYGTNVFAFGSGATSISATATKAGTGDTLKLNVKGTGGVLGDPAVDVTGTATVKEKATKDVDTISILCANVETDEIIYIGNSAPSGGNCPDWDLEINLQADPVTIKTVAGRSLADGDVPATTFTAATDQLNLSISVK